MSYHHININQLTNIESNYYLGVNARECARRMKIGKDKVYNYYRLLKMGFTVEEIYFNYKQNKKRSLMDEQIDSKIDSLNTKYKYVIYTKNEKDKYGNIILYLGKLEISNNKQFLVNIENNTEWENIKNIINKMTNYDNVVKGEDNERK